MKSKYIKFLYFLPTTRNHVVLDVTPTENDLKGVRIVADAKNAFGEDIENFPIAEITEVRLASQINEYLGSYMDGTGDSFEVGTLYEIKARIIDGPGHNKEMKAVNGITRTGEKESEMRKRVIKEWAEKEPESTNNYVIEGDTLYINGNECVEMKYRWHGIPRKVLNVVTEGNEYSVYAFKLINSF